MTTMLSLILAFMLSIGGSPAASVNPAGCPGDTGIQASIENNRTINRFFDDYREKTASRPISKKILEIPLIKQPKTQTRLRFTLDVKEELRLMGYIDSMNPYQAFNMNPVNFTDPFGKQHQVTVTPEGAEFERPMTVGEFWETLMEAGVSQKEALDLIADSTYYSKYFWDGSLVDRIKTHKMDLTLTKSEARALGMEYNFTLKGPREQFGRLFRGEFKEFKDAALENLDRAFGDPENAALMFSGGVKYKGPKATPKWKMYENKYGSTQTSMEIFYKGQKVKVRLDNPPTSTTILDFKDYVWSKEAYKKPFIQEAVIKSFKEQIEKYKSIRKEIIYQFSSTPPKWVIEAIKKIGGKYIVKN